MNSYTETNVKIDFNRGIEFTPTIVFDGVELETKTFSNKTHQIEELIEYINYNENGGCDVFI